MDLAKLKLMRSNGCPMGYAEIDQLIAEVSRLTQLCEDQGNWLKTVQEMNVLMTEGSGAIAKLSAHPAVAHLCMILRKKEEAESALSQAREEITDLKRRCIFTEKALTRWKSVFGGSLADRAMPALEAAEQREKMLRSYIPDFLLPRVDGDIAKAALAAAAKGGEADGSGDN